jgi:hypothetical protein
MALGLYAFEKIFLCSKRLTGKQQEEPELVNVDSEVSEITELSKEDDIKPLVASNEFDQSVEGRLNVRGDLEPDL